MLPAPAQGAILIACKANDERILDACAPINDAPTEICTRVERDFLKALLGGCATPISALAKVNDGYITLSGNILSVDGIRKVDIHMHVPVADNAGLGAKAANELLNNGGQAILDGIRNEQ